MCVVTFYFYKTPLTKNKPPARPTTPNPITSSGVARLRLAIARRNPPRRRAAGTLPSSHRGNSPCRHAAGTHPVVAPSDSAPPRPPIPSPPSARRHPLPHRCAPPDSASPSCRRIPPRCRTVGLYPAVSSSDSASPSRRRTLPRRRAPDPAPPSRRRTLPRRRVVSASPSLELLGTAAGAPGNGQRLLQLQGAAAGAARNSMHQFFLQVRRLRSRKPPSAMANEPGARAPGLAPVAPTCSCSRGIADMSRVDCSPIRTPGHSWTERITDSGHGGWMI